MVIITVMDLLRMDRLSGGSPMRTLATVPQSAKNSAMVSSSADQGRFLTNTVLLPLAAETSTLGFFCCGACAETERSGAQSNSITNWATFLSA